MVLKSYLLKDEGDISNYLLVNINESSDGTFKLSQLHLVEKIINRVGIELSASLKAIEMPTGNPLLHKDSSSLGRKFVWSYRPVSVVLCYIQGPTQPEISMTVHQCAKFCNNPRIVHERAVI